MSTSKGVFLYAVLIYTRKNTFVYNEISLFGFYFQIKLPAKLYYYILNLLFLPHRQKPQKKWSSFLKELQVLSNKTLHPLCSYLSMMLLKYKWGWWTLMFTLAALCVPCFRIFCVSKNCTGWWTVPLPYILLMYTSTHTRSLLGALFLYIWGIYQFKRLMDILLTLVALWVPCFWIFGVFTNLTGWWTFRSHS